MERNLTIARIKNFELRYKTYICKHNYTTHDIEIVKWDIEIRAGEKREYCYTIGKFDDDGSLIDCCDRLLNSIQNMCDLDIVQKLSAIGRLIITTTEPTAINL